ncbi:MAG TPA: amine dehydrogenase large subunit, partial [Candidatus Binataceae bacterium]|nr:amine dehydrogenase large subunit [Candidatus Binataceae bacterium]
IVAAAMLATPGCAEILVVGAREFASVCRDGSMLTTTFDDNAKATAQKKTAKPFFDVEKDPVFGVPAMFGKEAYFVSYHGMVHPMDLSTSPATPGEAWPLLTQSETKAGWRPGGWQPIWGYAKDGLLYVLMHQGGREWSHKDPGSEVWVYSVRGHKRVDHIPLPQEANSILVSQDADPILFALSTQPAMMQAFSARKGKYLGAIKGLAGSPFELFGL